MESVISQFRLIHIAAGMIALFVAPVAMAAVKGARMHRLFGKIYFWAMMTVVVTALVISIYKENLFLLLVAVFSFYLSFSAYRWLYLKKVGFGEKPKIMDWAVAVVVGLFNVWLTLKGIFSLLKGNDDSFAVIALVFGIIGLMSVLGNIRIFFSKPKNKFDWFLNHMGGMLGSYVATVSAFSAVNFYFLPVVVRWLWPTVIGIPLIYLWANSYKRKFLKGKTTEEVARVEISI